MIPIPPNKPRQRTDNPDLIYRTEDAKFAAVVDDIVERHEEGQPILVGTVSVEKSERLSSELRRRASRTRAERQVPRGRGAHRGRGRPQGAVTVATNMAGRGTDIMLGGNPRSSPAPR